MSCSRVNYGTYGRRVYSTTLTEGNAVCSAGTGLLDRADLANAVKSDEPARLFPVFIFVFLSSDAVLETWQQIPAIH